MTPFGLQAEDVKFLLKRKKVVCLENMSERNGNCFQTSYSEKHPWLHY